MSQLAFLSYLMKIQIWLDRAQLWTRWKELAIILTIKQDPSHLTPYYVVWSKALISNITPFTRSSRSSTLSSENRSLGITLWPPFWSVLNHVILSSLILFVILLLSATCEWSLLPASLDSVASQSAPVTAHFGTLDTGHCSAHSAHSSYLVSDLRTSVTANRRVTPGHQEWVSPEPRWWRTEEVLWRVFLSLPINAPAVIMT